MIMPGLVSVTFRRLAPEEIIELALQAKLEGIEWGGDVHVPHGDFMKAREVRKMTNAAGLAVAAYGSYYRIDNEKELPFSLVLETAINLGAPVIRVWAGSKESARTDDKYRASIISQSVKIAEMASKANIIVAYEFHRNTLTDTNLSALMLLDGVAHPNMKIYWQPPHNATADYCLEGLKSVLPKLTHLHVFNWFIDKDGRTERRSLDEAGDVWARYINEVKSAGTNHFAMLEFVKDDMLENLIKDSLTLHRLLK